MPAAITTPGVANAHLFGLFPDAPGGRALRDTYGRNHLLTIAATGGQTTLERYGKD